MHPEPKAVAYTARLTIALIAGALTIAGCASSSTSNAPTATTSTTATTTTAASQPAAVSKSGKPTTVVKGPDGKEIGEYVGPKPAPSSKFAKLTFGMSSQQAMNLLGAPTNSTVYQTGKQWIPFYFGADAGPRTQLLFRGEGCLTFTGGNVFGGGRGELIIIEADPKGACFDS